jgi:hypothetical protein
VCQLSRPQIHLQGLPLALCLLSPLYAEIRGAALLAKPDPAILTWGARLQSWPLTGAAPTTLLAHRDFGAGGCIADVDSDGLDDLLVQEHPGVSRFLWLQAPNWTPHTIENETDFTNCLPFTIAGKRGVLLTHLHSQVRFYLFPSFEYKELYSIYTASQQGGLLPHDVDGDGLTDLFVGNYWMKNPGALDVAWRIFAVNLWHDTPTAARAALALWRSRSLVWAATRVAVFHPPPDVKQLWVEHSLAPLDQPRAILVHPRGIFIGHAAGVALESPVANGAWKRTTISRVPGILQLINWRDNVIAVSPAGLHWIYPLR